MENVFDEFKNYGKSVVDDDYCGNELFTILEKELYEYHLETLREKNKGEKK